MEKLLKVARAKHFLMVRDNETGRFDVLTFNDNDLKITFSAEEVERLGRGLPVDRKRARWADMSAITREAFQHWDETP